MRLWNRRKPPLVMAPKDDRPWYTVVERRPGLVLIETTSETGRKNRTWVPSRVPVDDVSA